VSFTNTKFAVFALCTFALYWFLVRERFRVPLLVLASLIFYGSGQPQYVALLLVVCFVNAGVSFQLAATSDKSFRTQWLIAGVALNLGLLCIFKYSGLLTARYLTSLSLPLGLSFFTFHGISLMVDHYRGELKPDGDRFLSHLNETTFYITFFPQLISGPITKAKNFIPQVREEKRLAEIDWSFAGRSLVIGYFLKMVVADNLGQEVSAVLTFPFFLIYSPADLLVALFGFSAQIFADFAGYSLIALGLAALFGYRLPINFCFPYLAHSFAEFWQRWHMSLSSWLRDYLYIPLGGNRKGRVRTYINLFLVMGLGGLWHGGTLNYAAWGLAHGTALATERAARNSLPLSLRIPGVRILQIVAVFVAVSFAWVLFRFNNFEHVRLFYGRLFSASLFEGPIMFGPLINTLMFSAAVAIYHLGSLLTAQVQSALRPFEPLLYGVLVALILLNAGPSQSFIYFQF
jgi:alginate O-acetyltransferase complex protein AlgI